MSMISKQIDDLRAYAKDRKGELAKLINDAAFTIELLSAKQPEPQWIPCSERLPEKGGQYLVTRGHKSCGNLWNRVYIVNYSDLMGLKKEKIWWSGNVGKKKKEKHDDVLAWMPLPEPYEEEKRNA